MAIEYLYDCVRATSGLDIVITAKIKDSDGIEITSGCSLVLSDDTGEIARVSGAYTDELWYFTIPKKVTDGIKGRYWYCIHYGDGTLCFKEPIYLI